MTTWNQGRDTIKELLAIGDLDQVKANRDHVDVLMAQAETHLASAEQIMASDPEAAYALVYDSARKALAAFLANQGLRPTTKGGHRVLYQAAKAELDPPLGSTLAPFDRMRRQRNQVEYSRADTPALTADDVKEELPRAQAILDMVTRTLDVIPVFR